MRQEKIICYLAEEKTIISTEKLINKFHISQRTLANDIKLINQLGKQYGYRVDRIRSKGYRLEIEDYKKFTNYKNSIPINKPNYSPESRLRNLKLMLLFTNEFITLQQMSDLLEVSVSTIKKDLKLSNDFLNQYDLAILSKAHYGVKILGDEDAKRKAIINLLKIPGETPIFTPQYELFKKKFDENDLRLFLKIILRKYKLKTSDIVFENIIQHIKLLVFRIQQKNMITFDISMVEIKSNDIIRGVTNEISNYLAEKYYFKLSDREEAYLEEQLLGKITILQDPTVTQELSLYIQNALKKIDSEYNTYFNADKELVSALLLHVSPLLQRLYTGRQLENPIIEDIYTRYANVFNLALEFIEYLNKNLNVTISKDEIGYVAIYFAASLEKQDNQALNNYKKIAVVHTSGGGASYLLKVNLERLFTNAVVHIFAAHETDEIDDEYDLLISTVPLEGNWKDIPVIFTKDMMTEQEIHRIEQTLSLLRERPSTTIDLNKTLLGLFNKEWFRIETGGDYLKTLESEGKKLEKAGWASLGFASSVLERERMIDTIYRKGIAGPHPMESVALREVINVVLFNPKPLFNQKEIQIFFLINIHKEHLTLHKEISRLMISMMEDDELEKQLAKIKNYQDFLEYMKELLKGA